MKPLKRKIKIKPWQNKYIGYSTWISCPRCRREIRDHAITKDILAYRCPCGQALELDWENVETVDDPSKEPIAKTSMRFIRPIR